MFKRIVFAPARPAACAICVRIDWRAGRRWRRARIRVAEEQKAAPEDRPKKAAPKRRAASAEPPQQQQGGAPDAPQLIYSPWTKFCLKGQEANAKQVCFTGKDGRVESGHAGRRRRADRAGRRAEQDPARHAAARHVAAARHARDRRPGPADDRALRDLLQQRLHGRLRGERRTDRQHEEGPGPRRAGDQWRGQPISLVLPLNDFAKAYDGPPTDPKVFEEQQKKLQDELQRRAEEARKKLEGQPK